MSTAAVESSTTATMESATAAMEPAATVESASRTVRKAASPSKATSACKTASADEPASAKTTTEARSEPSTKKAPATEPRPGSDKYSTGKPARPVVPIGCTRVRGVSVVSVFTYGRRVTVVITRPKSHANPDLRLRIGQRQHQHRNQSQIFHVPHVTPLVQIRLLIHKTRRISRPSRFYFNLQSESPIYLNSGARKKLQVR
jgi:hypothetical protein